MGNGIQFTCAKPGHHKSFLYTLTKPSISWICTQKGLAPCKHWFSLLNRLLEVLSAARPELIPPPSKLLLCHGFIQQKWEDKTTFSCLQPSHHPPALDKPFFELCHLRTSTCNENQPCTEDAISESHSDNSGFKVLSSCLSMAQGCNFP